MAFKSSYFLDDTSCMNAPVNTSIFRKYFFEPWANYLGFLIIVALFSEKHLPLLLVLIALFVIVPVRGMSLKRKRESFTSKCCRLGTWPLLACATLSLFSPIDLRFRRAEINGVRFLPVIYSGRAFSKRELEQAIVDPNYILKRNDPTNFVHISKSQLTNRANYAIVIDIRKGL